MLCWTGRAYFFLKFVNRFAVIYKKGKIMQISNSTFSAMIRKYDNTELKPIDAEQMQAQDSATIFNMNFVNNAEDVVADENNIALQEATIPTPAVQAADTDKPSDVPDLDYIKELIYNSHHSFIANFRDADTFLEYVSTRRDSTVTKEGISRAQLVKLTQNDVWEDNHQDFFGLLNRSFYSLDKDNSGVLEYEELKEFFSKYLKKDGFNEYKVQVQAYADEVQNDFSKLKGKAKINRLIELTKDYLTALGAKGKNQLDALERLTTASEDKFTSSDMHVGQLSFKPDSAFQGMQAGGYVSGSYVYGSYNGYFIKTFGTDDDTETKDYGIYMRASALNNSRWEILVDTLVHELTHATAYQYNASSNGTLQISEATITRLYNAGVFKNDEEYNLAKANYSDLKGSYTLNGDKWYEDGNLITDQNKTNKLFHYAYMATAVSGEYMAYQFDADFIDSIGADVLQVWNKDNTGPATQVDGDKEKEKIEDHIKNDYDANKETGKKTAKPDWTWWTYA